ncbi:VWA domain-containing protein [Roseococcus pinisoli]|uniref:VWA domain-containing protein n=1 Tax=Roseococcus pinisoli TaxID=2835040 RepID=A0ABS5QEP9_9PROT|nr:VWA domain-containing protein [Roseococcus pinisoli]
MSELHLLRPWWLLLLLLAPLPLLLDRVRHREAGGWRGIVAPHLLDALLMVQGTRSRLRPAMLAAAMLAVLAVCLAGPAWRHERSPFVTDSATMVVALDLSRASAPALEAGKRKIRDLVAARGGARTGLVAYAGTAHAVLPPTDDPRLIETYLDALAPEVMPRDGQSAAAAARTALRVLDAEPGAGTLILVTPAVPAVEAAAFAEAMRGSRHAALVLATGPGPFEGVPGAGVIARTPDGADVARIVARAQRHFSAAPTDDPTMRWQDAGPWLALLLVPLALPWARRGMLVAAVMILPAQAAEPGWFSRLWRTPDQQARLMLERGDAAGAAALFTDPVWRGVALYRAGDYEGSAAAFALRDTAEAQYDRGNALMMRPRGWDDAIPAYDRALQLRPDFPEARANRDIAIAFRAQWQAAEAQRAANQTDQQQHPGDGDTQIDQTPPGPQQQEDASPNRVAGQGLSDGQIQEMWMRRVGGTPREFLRLRFARQAQP